MRPPRVPGSGDFVRRFDPLATMADVPDGSRCAGHFMAQFAPGDPVVFMKGWAAFCRLAPESQDDFVKRLSEEIAMESPGNGYTLDSDEHGGNIAVVPYDEGDLRGTVTIVSSPVSNGLELTLILEERSAQP